MVGFAVAIAITLFSGRHLVELLLPLAHTALGWVDDRFSILFLGIDRTAQDTVIRLKVGLLRMLVVGTQVVQPDPKAWLEVTTTIGVMLQPMTIGIGIALAWPGNPLRRLACMLAAFVGSLLFMLIDLPLTLHAYVWDMFLQAYDRHHFSPMMITHRFLNDGGRLGIGVAIGLMAILLVNGNWRLNGKSSQS